MADRIELNADATLCILSVTVKGIETHSEELSEDRAGSEKTTRREVTTTIADVDEAASAKKLANKVRSAFAKYVVTVHNFTVSDPARIAEFEREVRPVKDLIAQHNAGAQFHPVEVEFTPIPLAASLTDAQAQRIYAEISQRLDACKTHFERGDLNAVAAWLGRNKNLGGFLPAAVAGCVDDAVGTVKEALSQWRKRRTDGENVEKVGLELAGNLVALDTARGLVTPKNLKAEPARLALAV